MNRLINIKRAASALGVVILVAAMLPVCAVMCWVAQPAAAARMMAAMPCCANTPSMHSPYSAAGQQDATITVTTKAPAFVAIAAVMPAGVVTPALTAGDIENLQPASAPAAPAFLLNEQFRI